MERVPVRVIGDGLIAAAVSQLLPSVGADAREDGCGELLLCAGANWKEQLAVGEGSLVPVIVLACSQQDLTAAAEVECAGVVWHADGVEDLRTAIRAVAAGQRYVSHSLASGAGREAAVVSARAAGVVRLAVQGLSNKQIARSTGLSIATVEYHLARAFAALQVKNRVELASRAHLLSIAGSHATRLRESRKVQGKP